MLFSFIFKPFKKDKNKAISPAKERGVSVFWYFLDIAFHALKKTSVHFRVARNAHKVRFITQQRKRI